MGLDDSVKSFFGFLRKKSKKKEEAELLEVTTDDLNPWFGRIETRELGEVISEANLLSNKIISDISSVTEKANELGDVEVEENELNRSFVISIRTATKSLSKKIVNAASSVDPPEIRSFWDAVYFRDAILKSIEQMDEAAFTHGKVVSRALKGESKILALAIKQLRDDVSKLEEFVKLNLDKAKFLKDIRIEIQHFQDMMQAAKEYQIRADETKEKLEESNSYLQQINSKQDELLSTKEFKKNQRILFEIKKVENNISGLENEILAMFSKLVRPFHKYEYTAGLRKDIKILLERYLKTPLSAVRSDKEMRIGEVLTKLSGGIQAGRIELKDSNKVLIKIEDLTFKLPEFQERLSRLDSELNANKESLDESLLTSHRSLEDEVVKIREAIRERKVELLDSQSRIDQQRTSMQSLILSIEEKLQESLGNNIQITTS